MGRACGEVAAVARLAIEALDLTDHLLRELLLVGVPHKPQNTVKNLHACTPTCQLLSGGVF